MIYAIRCSATGHIKFGKARNPKRRMDMLQTGNAAELQLVTYADWPDEEEARIHSYLQVEWVRGEWFERSHKADKVISFLKDGLPGLEAWHKQTIKHRHNRPFADKPSFAESRLAKILEMSAYAGRGN